MNTRSTTRLMTSDRVKATLAKAGIPNLGANRFTIIGRGNPYTREDGTAIKIYNLEAFRSLDDKKAAREAWLAGYKLEKANDLNGAQEHYKEAMNNLMSFSVLIENAPDYDQAREITGIVEEVPSREDEDVLVLGINRPRPISVTRNFAADSVSFDEPLEDEAPATTTSSKKGMKKGKLAGAK